LNERLIFKYKKNKESFVKNLDDFAKNIIKNIVSNL